MKAHFLRLLYIVGCGYFFKFSCEVAIYVKVMGKSFKKEVSDTTVSPTGGINRSQRNRVEIQECKTKEFFSC